MTKYARHSIRAAVILAYAMYALAASAQHNNALPTLALKGGESQDVSTVYYISNCRSLLLSPPVADLLEAPPGLQVSVRAGDVLPRSQSCAKPVKGGGL